MSSSEHEEDLWMEEADEFAEDEEVAQEEEVASRPPSPHLEDDPRYHVSGNGDLFGGDESGLSVQRAQELERLQHEAARDRRGAEQRGATREDDEVKLVEWAMGVGVGDGVTAARATVTMDALRGAMLDLPLMEAQEQKECLERCNKLRRALGPLFEACDPAGGRDSVVAPQWPVLTEAQLFHGRKAEYWQRHLNDLRDAWRACARLSTLEYRFEPWWRECERQARIKINSGGAPAMDREAYKLRHNPRTGALVVGVPDHGDEHEMPAPCAAVRTTRVAAQPQEGPTPPGNSQLDPAVRPRYSEEVGKMLASAHKVWSQASDTPCATLRTLESGAYSLAVPLRVPLDRADPMFGAASFLLVDGVRNMLRSAAAARVAKGDISGGSQLVDASFAADHADAFRAWAGISPATPVAEFAAVLSQRRAPPARNVLLDIEAEELWRVAAELPAPGDPCYDGGGDFYVDPDNGDQRSPRMVVSLGHLTCCDDRPFAPSAGVELCPTNSGVVIVDSATQRSSTVRYRAQDHTDECGFTLRCGDYPDGFNLRAGREFGHGLWFERDEYAPDDPVPAHAARRAAYTPAEWSTEAIRAAEEAAAAARAREPRVVQPVSLLAGRTSLFDIDALWMLFATAQPEAEEASPSEDAEVRAGAAEAAPASGRRGKPASTLPPESATLQALARNFLSMRRVDAMLKVAVVPVEKRADDPTPIWLCDTFTHLWQPRTESRLPSGKHKGTQAHGGDSGEINAPVQALLVDMRRLVRSDAFYDSMFGVVQLALYQRGSDDDRARGKEAETVLKRVLAAVRREGTDEEGRSRPLARASAAPRAEASDVDGARHRPLVMGGAAGGDELAGEEDDGFPAADAEGWLQVLRAAALALLRDIHRRVVANGKSFRGFLGRALEEVNEHSDRTMALVDPMRGALDFSPAEHFCTGDRRVYRWVYGKLINEPLRSAHRFERIAVSPLSVNDAWIADATNANRLRALLKADYHGCDAPDAPGAADETPHDERVAQAYAAALATADALAHAHPNPDGARRFYRGLLRLVGYPGGVTELLFQLTATVFGLRALGSHLIVTSHEDSEGNFIAGGGKTTLMKLIARLLYGHGTTQRFPFLDAADLNMEDGGVRANPNLSAAIESKALGIVVDEMGGDPRRMINPAVVNQIVTGNGAPAYMQVRTLHGKPTNELLRVVNLWYISNHKSTLAALLGTPGQARRSRLLALDCVFVSMDAFVQYGNWPSKEAALEAYDGDDLAYARHMQQHAPNGAARVTDALTRARLESVGLQWQLVAPSKDGLNDSNDDAERLLELVLLYATTKGARPTAKPHPPAHCTEIFERLQALQKRDGERARTKRALENNEITDEQYKAQQKCTVPQHLGVDHTEKQAIVCAAPEGTKWNALPVTLGAARNKRFGERVLSVPSSTYEALFDILIKQYEPLPAGKPAAGDTDKRDCFDLKFFVAELSKHAPDVLRDLRATPGAAGKVRRKDSPTWIHAELNNAIDLHNGTLFERLGDEATGGGEAFVKERVPRDSRDATTARNRRSFHTMYNAAATSCGCFLGWRARARAPPQSGQDDSTFRHYAMRESQTVLNNSKSESPGSRSAN